MNKAIELVMEIVLKVPHLSFVLQGEDTFNFKAKYMPTCLLGVAVVVVVVAAYAHTDADADDACFAVAASV